MADVGRVWKRVPWILIIGNLVGALLTFAYFRVIDPGPAPAAQGVGPWEVGYFVVGMGVLLAAGSVWVHAWTKPLFRPGPLPGPASETAARIVRRRALLLPYMLTIVSLAGWV